MLLCIAPSFRFPTRFPKEASTASPAGCPPGCPPSSLPLAPSEPAGRFQPSWSEGQQSGGLITLPAEGCAGQLTVYQPSEVSEGRRQRQTGFITSACIFSFPLSLPLLFPVCFPSPNNAALWGEPVVRHPVILTHPPGFVPQLLIFLTPLA